MKSKLNVSDWPAARVKGVAKEAGEKKRRLKRVVSVNAILTMETPL